MYTTSIERGKTKNNLKTSLYIYTHKDVRTHTYIIDHDIAWNLAKLQLHPRHLSLAIAGDSVLVNQVRQRNLGLRMCCWRWWEGPHIWASYRGNRAAVAALLRSCTQALHGKLRDTTKPSSFHYEESVKFHIWKGSLKQEGRSFAL